MNKSYSFSPIMFVNKKLTRRAVVLFLSTIMLFPMVSCVDNSVEAYVEHQVNVHSAGYTQFEMDAIIASSNFGNYLMVATAITEKLYGITDTSSWDFTFLDSIPSDSTTWDSLVIASGISELSSSMGYANYDSLVIDINNMFYYLRESVDDYPGLTRLANSEIRYLWADVAEAIPNPYPEGTLPHSEYADCVWDAYVNYFVSVGIEGLSGIAAAGVGEAAIAAGASIPAICAVIGIVALGAASAWSVYSLYRSLKDC